MQRFALNRETSWGWFALFAAALILRLWRIDRLPLWLDETTLIQQASQPFSRLIQDIIVAHPAPPLFFLLMGAWIPHGPPGELWARLPSAVLGAGFVVATAWLARELGGRRATPIAAGLALFDPLALWYAQEARTYALSMGLAAATLALEVRFLRRGSTWLLPAMAVCTVMLELSHYAAVLALVIATILAAAYPTGRGRRGWALVALWIGAIPLLGTQEARDYAANLESTLRALGRTDPSSAASMIREVVQAFSAFGEPWTRFVGGPSVALVPVFGHILGGLAVVGLLWLLLLGTPLTRVVLVGFCLACGVALLFPQTRILISERYLALTLGPLLAATAAALGRIRPAAGSAGLGVVLALFLAADSIYWFDPRVGKGPNYREPAYYLAAVAQAGDVLVETDQDHTFSYYALRVLEVPVQEVRPRTGFDGSSQEETNRDLEDAIRGARSVWYMPRWSEGYWDPEHRIRMWLDAHLCLESNPTFDVVELRHYATGTIRSPGSNCALVTPAR